MVEANRLSTLEIGSLNVGAFDEWSERWHHEPFAPSATTPLLSMLEGLHWANFELWHQEDKARDPGAHDSAIAAAKRCIDAVNQRRNDQIEQCDGFLLAELARDGLPNPQAEPHSETPGLMLDRLSILSLKRYHTLEQIARIGSPAGHRERNRERLEILSRQRADLAECLTNLWQQVLRGERRFGLYRQLKMYNDPDLNPVLYGHAER